MGCGKEQILMMDVECMQDIRVSLPWNLRNYVAINGFHPLYRFLLNNTTWGNKDKSPRISLLTLNENHWKDYLTKPSTLSAIEDYLATLFTDDQVDEAEFKEFWSFFDVKQILIDEASDYDLKLIHTSLMSCELKPYVYHLESFETLFLPWQIFTPFFAGVSEEKIQKIRLFLKNKLEHPNCLAIVSHVKLTVDRIRDYFDSEVINNKLFYSPVGVDCPKILKKNESNGRRFIFTASMHGNLDNLVKRGMMSFFIFIVEWKKLYPEDSFIFLSNEVNYHFLSSCISRELYDEVVGYEKVLFLGNNYIKDDEFSKILVNADYIFLLSYQLHTISILKSMAYGVIPIVIDLPEIVNYGINEENAVMLKCYKNLIFEKNSVYNQTPTVDSFLSETRNGVPAIIDRLKFLKNNPIEEMSIREKGMSLVETYYNSSAAYNSLFDIIVKQFSKHKKQENLFNIKPFKSKDKFGSLSYFIPKLDKIEKFHFDKRMTFSQIINTGKRVVFGNGASYFCVSTTDSSIPTDLAFIGFRNLSMLQSGSYSNSEFATSLEMMKGDFISRERFLKTKYSFRAYIKNRSRFIKLWLVTVYSGLSRVAGLIQKRYLTKNYT